jgi:hypothetical protein
VKSVLIVILGLLATVGTATRSGVAHTRHESARQSETVGQPATTTLESVVTHGNSSVLVLRAANAKLFDLKVPAGTSIGTQNEGRIAASDLRSGDRLVLRRDGGMQDISQRTVALSGVVAYAPMSNNDVMTVQITPSRTVLVDVAPQTRFTDITRKQTLPTDVVDADTVAIHGVLDITMDEVVVAQEIERLGPKFSRTYSSG